MVTKSPRRASQVIAAMAVLTASCTSSMPPAGTPPHPRPLPECIQGWWLENTTSPCGISCTGTSPAPECTQSDCQQQAFAGYLADGTTYDGVYSFSPTGGTFSAVVAPVRRTYTADASDLTVAPPGRAAPASCTNADMTIDTYRIVVRASDALSAQLAARVPAGTWRGQPLPR